MKNVNTLTSSIKSGERIRRNRKTEKRTFEGTRGDRRRNGTPEGEHVGATAKGRRRNGSRKKIANAATA
jgi:hypothetical protein